MSIYVSMYQSMARSIDLCINLSIHPSIYMLMPFDVNIMHMADTMHNDIGMLFQYAMRLASLPEPTKKRNRGLHSDRTTPDSARASNGTLHGRTHKSWS